MQGLNFAKVLKFLDITAQSKMNQRDVTQKRISIETYA